VAAEEDGRGIGRIRLRHIRDASSSSLLPFVKDSIEPGSTVHTDGWLGYLSLETNGYQHRITYLKDHAEQASVLAAADPSRLLAAEAMVTGNASGSRPGRSISRITWTSSRSASTGANHAARGKLFYRLAQQAVATEPTIYRQIVDSAQLQQGV